MSDSDSDEENIVKYGTPLEPYEEDEIPTKRKYQQQPDQYAVDDHGRRRFHGAFTGGFSAGYGNTVGTPEGWAPSTFKSSRSEKAQFSNQRPEDFMDDEDRGDYGIAPRLMQTQSDFSGQKRPHQRRYHDGPIPGEPVLEQLVRAVHETAAVKILRSMGWKEGQGTGDRLTAQEKKKKKDQHKVYGCYMPPELRQTQEDSSDSEYDFDTLFAPDDYEPYVLQRKNDRFGLGYSGLSRHSVLGHMSGEYGAEGPSSSHLRMKDKGRKVSIRGQAFGVGAFEADDEDIYATEDMSHYDFAIGGPKDKPKGKPVNKVQSRNVLEGFVKSSKPLPSVPSYPPPALPRDYTPAAAGTRRSRFEPSSDTPRDQGLGRHDLTAQARGALLGEKPNPHISAIQPKHTNVDSNTVEQASNSSTTDPIAKLLGKTVDFISTNNKNELTQPQNQTNFDHNTAGQDTISTTTNPIANLLGKTVDFVSNNKTEENFIPIKDSGKDLVKVFKPFVGNPAKQARYERYLERGVLEPDGDMDRLSEWEREREMLEFEQAAKLYRPLSGVMGDRFTHAAEPDEALNPLCAVSKSSTNYGLATAAQIEAAKAGMYGVMTRTETSWRPEALVCKRFNVPDPGGPRMEQKKEDKPKISYSIFSYLESSVHDKDSFTKEQSTFSGSKSLPRDPKPIKNDTANSDQANSISQTDRTDVSTGFNKRMTVAELFLKESEQNKAQGKAVDETIDKFDKMDLFKSIFLSDSEDETTTNDNKVENEGTSFLDTPKNVERNTSPPRGIFANIDFDELNSWKRRNLEPSKDVPKTIETIKSPEKLEDNLQDVYGPKIPENLQKRLQTESVVKPIEVSSSSSEDSWVDVNEVKSKKSKKKKSKKHKSKHKKKSKSKKKDR